jgi:hypothetical protein
MAAEITAAKKSAGTAAATAAVDVEALQARVESELADLRFARMLVKGLLTPCLVYVLVVSIKWVGLAAGSGVQYLLARFLH